MLSLEPQCPFFNVLESDALRSRFHVVLYIKRGISNAELTFSVHCYPFSFKIHCAYIRNIHLCAYVHV